MHRCYHPGEKLEVGRIVRVCGEEAHHALRVMRHREGEHCELFDGEGRAARGCIVSVGGGEMQVKLEEVVGNGKDTCEITLAVAVPKGALMELIVQKAVEMGVHRIIPLITERTIVRIMGQGAEAKAAKWNRTALEACKQCGVNTLPIVEVPCSFRTFLREVAGEETELKVHCALVPEARPIREVLEAARERGERRVMLLVGPEGDFTPEENAAAAGAGFEPVSLGATVLRVESAAFFAVAAARYALDPATGTNS